MERDQAAFVASELRRLAPDAATPDGGTSHVGRRAFIAVAELLESVVRVCDGKHRGEAELNSLLKSLGLR